MQAWLPASTTQWMQQSFSMPTVGSALPAGELRCPCRRRPGRLHAQHFRCAAGAACRCQLLEGPGALHAGRAAGHSAARVCPGQHGGVSWDNVAGGQPGWLQKEHRAQCPSRSFRGSYRGRRWLQCSEDILSNWLTAAGQNIYRTCLATHSPNQHIKVL